MQGDGGQWLFVEIPMRAMPPPVLPRYLVAGYLGGQGGAGGHRNGKSGVTIALLVSLERRCVLGGAHNGCHGVE